MCRLVEDLMEKSPTKRPSSAQIVAERLAKWATSEQPAAPPRGSVGDPVVDDWDVDDWGVDLSGSGKGPSSTGSSRPRHRASATKPESLLDEVMKDAQEAFEFPPTTRASLRTVARVVGVALAAGLGFSVLVGLVQGIDPERFRSLPLIGSLRPAAFGWAGFLVMVALQSLAAWSDRRP
jgi:hypothetical protein